MIVLLTGMSGSGKSAVVGELRRRGVVAYDADDDGFTTPMPHGGWGWRTGAVRELFSRHRYGVLVFAGCSDEQREFAFDLTVLLTAPQPVLLERVRTRRANPYGKDPAERDRIVADIRQIEPLLRRSADVVVDTTQPLAAVANLVVAAVRRRQTATVPDHETPPPARWSAATSSPDMWVDPGDDPRDTGTTLADERSTLREYLRAYRLTLELKCADLDAEAMARRSVPPSTMSLLGMVRHMAGVERSWFRRTMAGEDAPKLYVGDADGGGDPDGDWNGAVADDTVVAQAWASWREEVAFAEQFVDSAPDLDVRGRMRDGTTLQLREVLVHMIEEYARHCGHADLLRERIDGRTGQ